RVTGAAMCVPNSAIAPTLRAAPCKVNASLHSCTDRSSMSLPIRQSCGIAMSGLADLRARLLASAAQMAHRLLIPRRPPPPARMRSAHRFHPLAEIGARRVAPLEAISRTEKVIAFCRVILATTTLAVVVADPRSPAFGPSLANFVVGAYAAYSILLF